MPRKRVTLTVPHWAKAGDAIKFSAAGKQFKTHIPNGLVPGQSFMVNIHIGSNGEHKISEAIDVSFNLEPNLVVGRDKYFKEIKTCGDWCDLTRICRPYVRFTGGEDEMKLSHQCCCIPCIADFVVAKKLHNENKDRTIGKFTLPSRCTDQNKCFLFCPCCYSGPRMEAKFVDPNDKIKFVLKSEIGCCDYLCVCLACCTPCTRCVRFCCMNAQYTQYTQGIYRNLNDDIDKPIANIVYVDRMVCPCLPDERMQIRIEQSGGANLSKDDLMLLSAFPAIVSGYTTSEFFCPLLLPGGMGHALPQPTGISAIDSVNNIIGDHCDIAEALKRRQDSNKHGQVAMK